MNLYLSNTDTLDTVMELTGLDMDELEHVVGRFKSHSTRAGQLRGELFMLNDGSYGIRHHFTKKVLWTMEGVHARGCVRRMFL